MGREEFCITCRAADPDCELHYYSATIAANDFGLIAAYDLLSGQCNVYDVRKYKWLQNVDSKTLFKALNWWWGTRA